MYTVLYLIDREFPGKRGGFVHVPYLPEQVLDKPNEPSLSLDQLVTALTAGLEAIVEYTGKPDLHTVGGAIH
jgi:pyroglutamyl-peptidase